jgi:hypothetical protein
VRPGAASVQVTVYYQSTSKEYVEFLRDENTTNTVGQEMYNLWNNSNKCPPEMMATLTLAVTGPDVGPDLDRDTDVDADDYGLFNACMTGPAVGPPTPECEPADFDNDDDVDQSDFNVYQRCFSGPDVPAAATCDD